MAARLQNAIVTSSAVSLCDRIASAREVASKFSVMESSWEVRIPLIRGMERTSRVEGEGGLERSHADGIRDWRSARLCCAMAFQGASEDIMADIW